MPELYVEQKGAVTTVESDNGFNLFVTSDVHFDSVDCNRDQFFDDIQFAVNKKMNILIVGDFFDAMQGRFDPRRDMSKVRPEYRSEKYYDELVDDAAKKLWPYRESIFMITDGNHEASVLKNANTDLIERLLNKLSDESHRIYRGGYGGIIMFRQGETTVPAKYFHGSGGEAPVTRGAIQTNRQAVFLPDFQIIFNGHSHHSYWMPIVRERVSPSGEQYFDIQHHVRTPGYHMSYGNGSKGWEVSRGGVPKPIGSSLVSINYGDILVTPYIHAPIPIATNDDLFEGTVYPQE